ncbi:hypothetical protein FD973_08945 [Polynucleobacter sp. MWH-Braz-FAM2G]|nr:hypothetical protein FD973_08945 [Polynucleobacter sp. MWH-Braz-FAM2G]
MSSQYTLVIRLLRLLTSLLTGGIIAESISCLATYFLINDSQVAGMVSHLLMQHLSYYFLGSAFVILSLGNILIKRGENSLRMLRMPSLILILTIAGSNFLLIPRMDYLRETALLDGMPVMLSPFANYFQILNSLVLLFLLIQITTSILLAWRLYRPEST